MKPTSRTSTWDPRRKLILSLDQGLFAAGTFLQRDFDNQLRTLREVVHIREGGSDAAEDRADRVRRRAESGDQRAFPRSEPDQIRVVCDPAAFVAGDREDNEFDWVRAVKKALGLPIYKAKSNSPALRNGAIWKAMDERGGYAVDRSCKHLIRGHLGGYRYRKAELAGTAGEMKGHLEIADTATRISATPSNMARSRASMWSAISAAASGAGSRSPTTAITTF
jgi:hypothetical protein